MMMDFRCWISAALVFTYLLTCAETASAAIIEGDALEVAVAAPEDAVKVKENSFEVFAADRFSYDDNIYSLSPEITNLQSLNGIGPNATRQDHIDTITLGLDGNWSRGRQTIVINLRADDNLFHINTNLNNISGNDKLVWNWNVGGGVSGQVGATYNSGLISYVNATDYARDLYTVTTYFGAGRYQIGPRWAIFGGVLASGTTLSEGASQANDLHTKSVALGSEFATSVQNSVGLEYRYDDAGYPPGTAINTDYREDAARVVVKQDFSEKTTIDANAGYLKRDYASSAIASFSGDVWRLSVKWHPTEKMKFAMDGWRNLQAYLSAQSDYFVSKGVSISPQWVASEKITVAFGLAFEDQNYIGVGESELSQGSRRDTVTTSQASIKYTPVEFLVFDFGYAYTKHASNESQYQFNDNLLNVRLTVKL